MIKQLQMKMLLIIALLGWGVSAGADTMGLTFDLSSNPGRWPDTDENVPTVLENYTYTLDDVDYTFALKNVKCYSGYTMISSGGVLGLPALEGYKLTKVVAKNSCDCSTATKVGISSSASSDDYIDGGDPQTWSNTSSSYTYDLTRTVANTMYYLYVTNENAQVVELQLTYDYINVELVDGQPFTNNVQKDGMKISYTRNFTNKWEALYIPFSMRYEEWKDDFEVAEILNIHEYDYDDDGKVDRTVLEILKMTNDESRVAPNCPYLIRPKEAPGEKTITIEDATLYEAEENSIYCASTKTLYTFKGTYQGISIWDMLSNGYYALSDGQLGKSTINLGTFRWYMKTESRDTYDDQNLSREMVLSIKVIGEDEDTEISGVTAKASDYKHSTEYYQLNGTRVSNPTSSGIFIVKDSDGSIRKIIKNRR